MPDEPPREMRRSNLCPRNYAHLPSDPGQGSQMPPSLGIWFQRVVAAVLEVYGNFPNLTDFKAAQSRPVFSFDSESKLVHYGPIRIT